MQNPACIRQAGFSIAANGPRSAPTPATIVADDTAAHMFHRSPALGTCDERLADVAGRFSVCAGMCLGGLMFLCAGRPVLAELVSSVQISLQHLANRIRCGEDLSAIPVPDGARP
jgi:hypothetical protein